MRINELIKNGDKVEAITRDMTAEEEAEWEKKQLKPTEFDKVEAQTLYTALMTDTLIEE